MAKYLEFIAPVVTQIASVGVGGTSTTTAEMFNYRNGFSTEVTYTGVTEEVNIYTTLAALRRVNCFYCGGANQDALFTYDSIFLESTDSSMTTDYSKGEFGSANYFLKTEEYLNGYDSYGIVVAPAFDSLALIHYYRDVAFGFAARVPMYNQDYTQELTWIGSNWSLVKADATYTTSWAFNIDMVEAEYLSFMEFQSQLENRYQIFFIAEVDDALAALACTRKVVLKSWPKVSKDKHGIYNVSFDTYLLGSNYG